MHRYDFDWLIVVFFLDNGNLNHILYIGDPFFSLSVSLPRTK
jgi:hypothetical protein